MADRLTVAQRVAALARLEAAAYELNEAACWLASCDAHASAEMAEEAAEKLAAAAWVLQAPIRAREPGLLAHQALAAGNGATGGVGREGRTRGRVMLAGC